MKKIVYGLLLSICLASCGSAGKLVTTHVAYQSVRSVAPKAEIPDNARIIVGYTFTDEGALVAVVKNNTDEVMILTSSMRHPCL